MIIIKIELGCFTPNSPELDRDLILVKLLYFDSGSFVKTCGKMSICNVCLGISELDCWVFSFFSRKIEIFEHFVTL